MPNPNPIQDMLATALSNAAEETAEVEADLAEPAEADEPEETTDAEEAPSEETEESAESEPTEAAEEQETDEDEPEDGASSAPAAKDDPFADLKTAKGIEKARKHLETQKVEAEKRQAGLDRGYVKLKKEEKALEVERKKLKDAFGPAQQLIGNIQARWKVVRTSPSVKERFFALGDILGYDGQRAYEELSLEIANDGKSPEPSQAERAYEERIRALEERLRAQQEGQTKAQKEAFIARRNAEIRTAAENAQEYPAIAAQVESEAVTYDHVVDYVKRTMREHYEATGTKLDEADALANLEESLLKARGKAQAKPASSGTSPKPVPSPQASPKPGQRKIGRTVTTTASAGVKRRELSREDHVELLSRDKDFVSSIFGEHAFGR